MKHLKNIKYLRNIKYKRILFAVAGILVLTAVFGAGKVYGASSQPGSSGDPLITLSYLNERLADQNSSAVYQKLTIAKGKTITFTTGSVVVLYSGSANVTGNSGLVNLTSGGLVTKGSAINRYQSYLSPDKSSGFTTTASITCFVSGSYSIR